MGDLKSEDTWLMDQDLGTTKLYHKWSFDPNSNEIAIDGDKIGEDNGYAYRLDGGWRITDIDHKKVEDFYIINKVLEALKDKKNTEGEDHDYDFDSLHYGQPLEINKEKSGE